MKILLAAIYPYAFLLLYLIIPFDNYVRALPNILLVVLVVAFPFVVEKKHFQKLKTIPVVLFFSFFLFLIVNALIFGRLETDITIIKKVLIAVGLLILYIPVHDAEKLKRTIIISSVATIVFSVLNILIANNTSQDFIFKNYPMLIESLLIDRLYLGLLSVLSIILSYKSLRPKFHPENRYYLGSILINILFLILIASKIALLVLVLLLILRQFYGNNKKIRIGVTLFAIAALSMVFFSVKEDLQKELFLEGKQQETSNFIKHTLTWDLRVVVWHCSDIIIKETGINLQGLGFVETKNQLVDCYQNNIVNTKKRDVFVSERYNSHNQFIDFYLSTGFLGFILFSGLLISLFFYNRAQFLPIALLLILTAYCMVENIFHRQLGAYYAGFIFIILLTKKWKNEIVKP